MVNIYELSDGELEQKLLALGQPKFRVKQVVQWVYEKGVHDFEQMTNLPKQLRETLSQQFCFGTLRIDMEQVSKDGTCKRLYRLQDNKLIESVLMPYRDGRRTACISSQAGCAMGCKFCATGQMGFARHLSAEDHSLSLAQVDVFEKHGHLEQQEGYVRPAITQTENWAGNDDRQAFAA